MLKLEVDKTTHSFPARVGRGPQSDQPGGPAIISGDCKVATSPSNQQGHGSRSNVGGTIRYQTVDVRKCNIFLIVSYDVVIFKHILNTENIPT
jgi:hypothetical protein